MIAAAPAPGPRPPREPGSIRAVFLAVLVHGAFFALIVFGVSWQSRPPQPVEVEIWDKLPPRADFAPSAIRPPEPEPAKEVELKPPPEIRKSPVVEKPAPPKPDAAIAERREREKRERLEKQKQAEAKKREEDLAKKKADAEKKKREDDKRRVAEEAAKREAQKAAEAAAAAQRSEIDKFINAIQAKIRGRANVPDTVRGNPEVHVLIKVLPGGDVLDIQITKRSGNPAYDSAIERGIRSASPLPVPAANSELFPRFRELNLQIRHER